MEYWSRILIVSYYTAVMLESSNGAFSFYRSGLTLKKMHWLMLTKIVLLFLEYD